MEAPQSEGELVDGLFADVEDDEEHEVHHCPRCDAPLVEREAKKAPTPVDSFWLAAVSPSVVTRRRTIIIATECASPCCMLPSDEGSFSAIGGVC